MAKNIKRLWGRSQELLRYLRAADLLGDFTLESRVHRLRTWDAATERGDCFVKRDDELGFGTTGAKKRKYASLVHSLARKSITDAIVIGGAQSNNVAAVSQLLTEKGIRPTAMLLEPRRSPGDVRSANYLLTTMVVPPERIVYLDRNEWREVDRHAQELREKMAGKGRSAVVLSEGCNEPATLPGLLTLCTDIIRNANETGVAYRDIFVDCGTGFTAASLLAAFRLLGASPDDVTLHVVQLVPSLAFDDVTARVENQLADILANTPFDHTTWSPPLADMYCVHTPTVGKSFGSVPRSVIDFSIDLAQSEGVLTDPVYTSKLFLAAKEFSERSDTTERPLLVVHTGGGVGLFANQGQISSILDRREKMRGR